MSIKNIMHVLSMFVIEYSSLHMMHGINDFLKRSVLYLLVVRSLLDASNYTVSGIAEFILEDGFPSKTGNSWDGFPSQV
jgi:hypothetical protein